MLLDYAVGVVVGVGAEHQAVLSPAAHCLGVDVIALPGVLHQPAALLPKLEILHGLLVHPGVVLFQDGVEVNFRLGYMQQGFLPRHLERLL